MNWAKIEIGKIQNLLNYTIRGVRWFRCIGLDVTTSKIYTCFGEILHTEPQMKLGKLCTKFGVWSH